MAELSPRNTARLTDFVGFPFHEAAGAPLGREAVNAAGDDERAELRRLTRAIRGGDEAAFGRFYDLYSLRIYKHLLVLARGDEETAREVLQTVLLKVSKRFEVFEDKGQLWAWLRQVARNAFVDSCRARKRTPDFVSLDALGSEPAEALAEEDRLGTALRMALDGLEAADRELIKAVYVDGQGLQEIADETGQTYKAIESRLGRLRRKVKEDILANLRHE
jgi:RNA polymerase sigma-70 factor (ECF subfamily)